jgi:hypothetical protein
MLDLKKKRQQLLGFLLRHSRIYPGGKNWTKMHERSWRSRPSIIRRSRSFSKIISRWALIMSNRLTLGARFRRQSLAPRGATLAGIGD